MNSENILEGRNNKCGDKKCKFCKLLDGGCTMYRFIVENSHDLIFLLNNKQIVEYVNEFGAKYFKAKSKDLVGKPASKLFHGGLPRQALRNLKKALKSKKFLYNEDLMEFPVGKVYLGTWLSPFRDKRDGRVVGVIGISRDITERKNAEIKKIVALEKASEFQKNLSDILSFLPDATLAINTAGKVIYWNRAVEKMTGVKAKDIIGKGNYEHALPFYGIRRPILLDFVFESNKKFKKKYHFIKREGDILTTEADVPVLGGEPRVLWAKASPLRNSSGKIIGAIESVRDITDRKKTESDLKESERRYKMIVDNVNDAFYLHDFKGKILDVNENACKMLGYTRNELIGANASMVDTPDQAKFIINRIQKLRRTGRLYFESQHRRKDGISLWVGVSAKIVSIKGDGLIESFVRDRTKEKQNEEKIKEGKERFESIFKYSSIGVSLTALDGHWLSVNNALCRITGYSRKQLLNYKFKNITYPDDVEKSLSALRELISGKSNHVYLDKRYIHKNGHIVWVHLSIALIRDIYKKPLYFVVHTEDITDHRRWESELNSRNLDLEKFKLAMENVSDQIIITDAKGNIIYANKALSKTTGYSANEVLGKNPGKLWGGIMSGQFYRKMWKTISVYKKPFISEINNVKKNGRKYTSEIKVNPILDSNKNILYFVGVERDLSQEIEAREFARNFIEQSPYSIQVYDWNGLCVAVNAAWEELWGTKAKDVVGHYNILKDKQVKEQGIMDLIKRAFKGETLALPVIPYISPMYRLRLIGKSASKYPSSMKPQYISSRISPVFNSEGKLIRVVLVHQDVTKEYTIDKAKSEFVSLASHQLRTPISIIKWYAEVLLKNQSGHMDAKEIDYVTEIYKGSLRMTELISALLNVSRLEIGGMSFKPMLTNLIKITDNIIGDLSKQIADKKITIQKNISKKLYSVNTDPQFAQIILQNFISNAVKYSKPEGLVKIVINKADGHLTIRVLDNGYGITAHQQSKIFTKLFRADNAKEIDPNGTGLGLYIVKLLVEAADGKIFFKSKENTGSVFGVSLPTKAVKNKD